jgi:hypothetical protein
MTQAPLLAGRHHKETHMARNADALKAAQKVMALQEDGAIVSKGPLYYRIHLAGLADSNGLLKAGDYRFFSAGVGDPGAAAGLGRQLTYADTNYQGNAKTMQNHKSFIAEDFGISYGPGLTIAAMQELNDKCWVKHKRGQYHWEMGATRHWPKADIGIQAQSTTAQSFNGTVNGRTPARVFEEVDLGIILLGGQEVLIELNVEHEIYMTTNGKPVGTDGAELLPVESAYIECTMNGYHYDTQTI